MTEAEVAMTVLGGVLGILIGAVLGSLIVATILFRREGAKQGRFCPWCGKEMRLMADEALTYWCCPDVTGQLPPNGSYSVSCMAEKLALREYRG